MSDASDTNNQILIDLINLSNADHARLNTVIAIGERTNITLGQISQLIANLQGQIHALRDAMNTIGEQTIKYMAENGEYIARLRAMIEARTGGVFTVEEAAAVSELPPPPKPPFNRLDDFWGKPN